MTKTEILSELRRLRRDRKWLSQATGYSYEYVKNSLAPKARHIPARFAAACEREISREARRLPSGPPSLWDSVQFTANETVIIDRARAAGGYNNLPALFRDAILDLCDRLVKHR